MYSPSAGLAPLQLKRSDSFYEAELEASSFTSFLEQQMVGPDGSLLFWLYSFPVDGQTFSLIPKAEGESVLCLFYTHVLVVIVDPENLPRQVRIRYAGQCRRPQQGDTLVAAISRPTN